MKQLENEQPKLIYQKNADRTLNRVVIPKSYIDKNGRKFIMKVYSDKILLESIKKEK